MACGSQETTGQGEEAHARARRSCCRTPPASLGQGRKELCFRFARGQENPRRSLRRQKPAHRLSLHVRPGVERRLPQLLVQHGSYGWRTGALDATRCFLRGGLTSALVQNEAFKKRMGWRFTWVSSYGTDFNYDYRASFTPDELAQGKVEYNFDLVEFPSAEAPGISIFCRDKSGSIFHTYSRYARGTESVLNTYNYLDLVPKGRDEDSLPFTMAWVRHHDRYADGYLADANRPYWPADAAPVR